MLDRVTSRAQHADPNGYSRAVIYHLLDVEEWGRRQLAVVAAEPGPEGFVHCCDDRQLVLVRPAYFPAHVFVVALRLDPTLLDAETRYEAGAGGEPERFAHVYGSIRVTDVLGVVEVGLART